MDYPQPIPPPAVAAPPSRASRLFRRLRGWFGLLLLGLFLLALILPLLYRWLADGPYEEAKRRAERLDPGHFRWADLDAKRPALKDEENAARVVAEAMALLPKGWNLQWRLEEEEHPELNLSGAVTFASVLDKVRPNVAYPPRLAARLAQDAAKVRAVYEKTAPLATLAGGRYPGERDLLMAGADPRLDEFQKSRGVQNLCFLMGIDLAERNDPAGAVAALRRQLGAARSGGDEPGLIPMLIRGAIAIQAAQGVERLLGQTEPDEADLVALQAAFAAERAAPILLQAFRGERALQLELYEATLAGQPTPLAGIAPGRGGNATPPGAITRFAMAGWWKDNGATVIDLLTDLAEVAKRGEPNLAAALDQFDQQVKRQFYSSDLARYRHLLGGMLMPAILKVGEAYVRRQALLGCAEGLLTAERFRLKHGRWPERIDELKPFWANEAPLDPYTGQPLRLKRTPTGLVIYSAGRDGKDDGGRIRGDPDNPYKDWTHDYGFQLWDVKDRRKPYQAPPWSNEGQQPPQTNEGPKPAAKEPR